MGEVVSLAASAGFRLSLSTLAVLIGVSRERLRSALIRSRIEGIRDDDDMHQTFELAAVGDVDDPYIASEARKMERTRCAVRFARVVEIVEATPRAPRAAIAHAHYLAGAFAAHLPGSSQAFQFPSDLVARIQAGAEDGARALLDHAHETAQKPKPRRTATKARRT